MQGQFAPMDHGQPLAMAFNPIRDPQRPFSLWVSWAFGCQGELDLNGGAVATDFFGTRAPGALAFDPVSGRLYVTILACQPGPYSGPTQIDTVDASTGAYLTVGKSFPNPGAQVPYMAVTGNGYLLTGGPKTPLTVLKLNSPGIWGRASFLSASASLLGSPISPPTVCHGSPCQYFEKGALLSSLTDAHSMPGGWLRDIGLPMTPAVQATVTKGSLGKRIITIQAFQDAILTDDPRSPAASRVERANIGSDYATAFPEATR
jgi:hypothetical protein